MQVLLHSLGATRAAFLAALGAAAVAVPAQSPLVWQWCERVPATHPTARAFAAFAAGPLVSGNDYFAVMFGGTDANGLALSETWEWDGAAWSLNANASTIPALTHTAMALDPNAFVGVLFGGLDSAGVLTDETWMYDFPPSLQFRAFQQQFPAVVPPARADHAMSPSGNGILLFGGLGTGGALGDTWTYDHRGRTWVQLTPAQSPPARSGHRMAYDLARDRVVLFGGRASNGTLLADTWEWDGANWAQKSPLTSPTARADFAMSRVEAAQSTRILVHGGTANGNVLSDAWGFDGTNWQPIVTITTIARAGHALAEMGNGQLPTTFGGATAGPNLADSTWTLEGYAPPSLPTTALVCRVAPACGSLPTLPSIQTDDAPIQDPFQVTPMTYDIVDLPLAPLPGSGLAAFVFGSVGGAAPCNPAFPSVLTNLVSVLPVAYSADSFQIGYSIPTTPNVVGASLFHQALAILPTANLQWVTSDLIKVRVGL